MSEWFRRLLSEILVDEQISYGVVQPGKPFYGENAIPILRVNNIKNGKILPEDVMLIDPEIEAKYSKTRLRGGELLITVVGTVGECAIVPHEMKGWNVARAISVARIKDEYCTRFIKYLFKTDEVRFQIYGNTNDTVQPTLNLKELKNISLSIPPLREQESIASILSSLDDKIDLLYRQNKILEEMVETLFRQWFETAIREENLLDNLGVLFLETIGGEWGKEQPDELHTVEAKCMRGTDIGSLIVGETSPPTRYLKTSKFDKCRLHEGDLVIEISGGTDGQSTGRAHFFDRNILEYLGEDVVFSNFCRLLRPKKVEYSYFLYSYLRLIYDRGDFFNLENGSSGIRNLALKSFLFEEKYFVPDSESIISFSRLVEPFYQKKGFNLQQIRHLSNFRDSLLPKLISGEITVA